MSNCLGINSVYAENINKGYGTLDDDCGDEVNKVGIQTFTGEMNVKDFGATGLGVNDESAAFYAAMLALPSGGRIIIPAGLYKVNLIITGNGYTFLGQQAQFSDTGTVGLAPFSLTDPAIQIGDGVNAATNIKFINVQVRPKSGDSASKGVKFYGCNRVRFIDSVVRGFSTYQIQLDSTLAQPTSYIYIMDCDIAGIGSGASLGIDINYGLGYVAAIFLSNLNITSQNSGSYCIDLEANCYIYVSELWVQAGNNRGVHIQANSARIKGIATIDSDSSNDVLVTCDFDGLATEVLHGQITVDGKIAFTSGNTESLSERTFLPYESLLLFPQIQGKLAFQATDAAKNLQHGSDTLCSIYRTSDDMTLKSETGNIQLISVLEDLHLQAAAGRFTFVDTAPLSVKTAAISDASGGYVVGNSHQTTIGAAGSASALPGVPLGYMIAYIGTVKIVFPYWAAS